MAISSGSNNDVAAPPNNAKNRATPHTTNINTLEALIVPSYSVEKNTADFRGVRTVSGEITRETTEKYRGKPPISRGFPRDSADRFTRDHRILMLV